MTNGTGRHEPAKKPAKKKVRKTTPKTPAKAWVEQAVRGGAAR
jgi:hypothetical protein